MCDIWYVQYYYLTNYDFILFIIVDVILKIIVFYGTCVIIWIIHARIVIIYFVLTWVLNFIALNICYSENLIIKYK